MNNKTYRGEVRNGAIVLVDDGSDLEEGTQVLVTTLPRPEDVRAMLAALKANPIPKEDVEELERAIKEGVNYRPSERFLSDDGA